MLATAPPSALAVARLEVIDRARQRAVVRERGVDGGAGQPFRDTAGTSGTAVDFAFDHRERAASSGDASTRAMKSAIRSISGFAHAARGHRRRAERMPLATIGGF